MVTRRFFSGVKSHLAIRDRLIPCSGWGPGQFLKFFNLSTREPSRGGVARVPSPCTLSYEVLNILNYLKLHIRDQGVGPYRAANGNSPDLEQFARRSGGRWDAPIAAPPFPLMVLSDSATFGPAALPPLHANPWRTT